jgi:hypothetical protein
MNFEELMSEIHDKLKFTPHAKAVLLFESLVNDYVIDEQDEQTIIAFMEYLNVLLTIAPNKVTS